MSVEAVTRAAAAGHPRRGLLIVIGTLGTAGLAAGVSGALPLPDFERILTELSNSLGAWTYLLVAALAFLETGAFVGLVAPGETAIVLGGVAAAVGSVDLAVLVPLVWLAAALGDLVSFVLGRKLGRRFLLEHGPAVGVTRARLEPVERFFGRHGAKAILIGRFVGVIRAVAPFTAGASGMPLRSFMPWSLLGTAIWATAFTLVGFAFHESFGVAASALTRGALVVAVIAAVALVWRHHRRTHHRAQSALAPTSC